MSRAQLIATVPTLDASRTGSIEQRIIHTSIRWRVAYMLKARDVRAAADVL